MALPTFTRLNEIVQIHHGEPSSSSTTITERTTKKNQQTIPPETVLLLTWGDAQLRHIEKYTRLYQASWPGSTIVLVRSGMKDFFWRRETTSRALIQPVVEILAGMIRPAGEDEGDGHGQGALFVHVMSNAGARQWCTIASALARSTGADLADAPTLVDSAPGRAGWRQTWAAVVASLPKGSFLLRMALRAVLGLVLAGVFARKWLWPWGASDPLEELRGRMNLPPPPPPPPPPAAAASAQGVRSSRSSRGRRRTYVYSREDEMIGWRDVEEHAGEAAGEGGFTVELVRFEGSAHVGHLRRDPERYWRTIEGVWFGTA
ncbi:uncharacterized protein K489DRAFT_411984 [Dissoconium aciculare CBS 342.82]|uniref:DUF829-domain-containing protein n=1 Tax=Dissoconium aciculare CBS 342.82 TaxID=1314786 RepID=A0A6J3LYD1_9PEZI|nr:uncharacterized protein K489DRAFT_411984 [Dissoconium aciculare CBS 342.82]KAF1820771.1 hypothetical protein K489DRAFT_411984 [Dissoconium aciculare CBS 342.82]